MHYRGTTWPQIGDQVRVAESGVIDVVEDIIGRGLSERFLVCMVTQKPDGRHRSYVLKEIRRAEPTPVDQPQPTPR